MPALSQAGSAIVTAVALLAACSFVAPTVRLESQSTKHHSVSTANELVILAVLVVFCLPSQGAGGVPHAWRPGADVCSLADRRRHRTSQTQVSAAYHLSDSGNLEWKLGGHITWHTDLRTVLLSDAWFCAATDILNFALNLEYLEAEFCEHPATYFAFVCLPVL